MKLILLTTLFALGFLGQGAPSNAAAVEVQEKYFQENLNLTEADLQRDMVDICTDLIESVEVTPKLTNVEYQLRTNTTSESFALTELDKIVTSRNFDPNKKLVLYISGFFIGLPRSGQVTVEKAYHVRNDTNFVATDSTHFLKTLVQWSIINVEHIGKIIGEGLARLVQEQKYPLENIHLIGHSMGVIIAGNAGRHFKAVTGKSIPRITGLDPANGCVRGDNVGVKADSADFIDIIHTDTGGMGDFDPLGSVDFYVGGVNVTQPGCIMMGCSHIRSCHYYAETLHPNNANNFLSVPCPSVDEVSAASCKGDAIPMGYKVPHTAKGIYYLQANSKKPYGKNNSYVEVPNDNDDDGNDLGNSLSYNVVLLSALLLLCSFVSGTFR